MCNKECNCGAGCAKEGKRVKKNRKVVHTQFQLFMDLAAVDTDAGENSGLLTALSEVVNGADAKEYNAIAGHVWQEYGRVLCRQARRIVKVVNKATAQVTGCANDFRASAFHAFPVYEVLFNEDPALFKGNSGVDTPWEYLVFMADSADKVFSVGEPAGLGYYFGNDGAVVSFGRTRFFCDENSGVSGMLVDMPRYDIVEKVTVKNSDGEFDYEKAAMALLLKGMFGGKGDAVKLVSYVENELRKAASKKTTKVKKEQVGDKAKQEETPSVVEHAETPSVTEQTETPNTEGIGGRREETFFTADEFEGN